MRELQAELKEHDDRRVRLAIEIFCYRARKHIAHTWLRWPEQTRSSLPAALEKTRPMFEHESARGWSGPVFTSTKRRIRRPSAARRDFHTRVQIARIRYPDRRGTPHRARHCTSHAGRAAPFVNAPSTPKYVCTDHRFAIPRLDLSQSILRWPPVGFTLSLGYRLRPDWSAPIVCHESPSSICECCG